jgi:hypothetical protein
MLQSLQSVQSHSLSVGETIAVSLLAAIVPAVLAGCASYVVARNKNEADRNQLLMERQSNVEGRFATLRQQYIAPLRYWASLLSFRMSELEHKVTEDYSEARSWFQEAKNHADGTVRIGYFPDWCCYVGIFAVTTLYWTCQFLRASRELRYHSPFVEVDIGYDRSLQDHLTKVRQAFVGQWGLWDSSQEIVAELISNPQGQTWNYQDFCLALDSRDSFKIGPLLRPFDYFIQFFSLEDSRRIQASLNELIKFLDSQRTPERR